jgi:hypothetical protein
MVPPSFVAIFLKRGQKPCSISLIRPEEEILQKAW